MAVSITQWCNEAKANVGTIGEFDTLEEALVEFHKKLPYQPVRITLLITGYAEDVEVELDAYEPQVGDTAVSFLKWCNEDDDDWREEIAMQAGMAFGCQGYNDVMGY